MKRRKHRLLLLGYGFWGKHWAQAILRRSDCVLAGVVTKPDETLERAQAKLPLGGQCYFSDFNKAIGVLDADIAVVVVPPTEHLKVVTAALEAGLHILSEKPLAANWPEAVKVARLARIRPRQQFMVAQTRRWSQHIQTLKRVIDSGRIGRIHSIQVDHRVHNRHPGWRESLEFPVLEDMAVHHFDALRFITGKEPVRVYAESWNPPWSWYQGKAVSSALIEFADGVHANYFGSWCTQGEQTTWEGRVQVVGESGSLQLLDEETLNSYPAGKNPKPAVNPTPRRIPIRPLKRQGIEYALDEFCTALREGREPECNIWDNLKTFALACAAVHSCRKGKPIELATMLKQLA